MARIFDVIEYPNEMNDEIVHRFPEEGIGDFRIGSQVIVRESLPSSPASVMRPRKSSRTMVPSESACESTTSCSALMAASLP